MLGVGALSLYCEGPEVGGVRGGFVVSVYLSSIDVGNWVAWWWLQLGLVGGGGRVMAQG